MFLHAKSYLIGLQLSTFYNVLLQLFDTLIVMNAVFFDVSKAEEASFLSFLCNDFSNQL